MFSSSVALGTYPLLEIPSTSSGSPTVLVANFMNGNNDALISRVYLWNTSPSAGKVTVRVFTLPVTGGTAQELTTAPLNLGSLEARSARNIKLAEDILTPLGILPPYTTDGGNLTLEFTIEAPDVRAAAQVFSSSLGLGTYPLQEIPSALNVSPTVLVANFMNGNNAFFNSRIYLWNPSESAGNVMVRAVTLERAGPSTLLGTVNLGSLQAFSARNIKLAEDILTRLGILLPYTDDGGNLTLEFTIEAANVRGTAQVFSSNLAFGTYPLQETVVTGSPGNPPAPIIADFNPKSGSSGDLVTISGNNFRIVLSFDASQISLFGFRDPQPVIRAWNVFRNIVPDLLLTIRCLHIVIEVLVVEMTQVATPSGRRLLEEDV